jgi:K+-transporting ATPase ATPase A chain
LQQTLPMGPVASQVAIKMLGTNGGGFFNANSAHPYENPTPLSNFLQMLAIFLIPAALCYALGTHGGRPRQGWAVLAAMAVMFVARAGAYDVRAAGQPGGGGAGVDHGSSALQAGRQHGGQGDALWHRRQTALFATITTARRAGP